MGGEKEVIALRRSGGMRPPQYREILEIQGDGTFRMWRSVSLASGLPSPVGRFSGVLPADTLAVLRRAASAAAKDGSRSLTVSPDSPVDVLEADGASITLGMRDPGIGAWKDLAALVRPLLKQLTDHPEAAMAIEIDGSGARLEHRGTETIDVDLSALQVRAVHWRGDQSEGRWTADGAPGNATTAGPGWTFELPFNHGFDLEPGDRIVVYALFSLKNGDAFVPVSIQTP